MLLTMIFSKPAKTTSIKSKGILNTVIVSPSIAYIQHQLPLPITDLRNFQILILSN